MTIWMTSGNAKDTTAAPVPTAASAGCASAFPTTGRTSHLVKAGRLGSSWFLVNRSASSWKTSPACLGRRERSGIVEQPLPQKAKACLAVHHAFDGFELVDFPFGGP